MVARSQPLRDNPLQTHPAGMLKDSQAAIVFKLLIDANTVAAVAQLRLQAETGSPS